MGNIKVKKIEKRRKLQGISIVDLSAKLGMSKQAYYDIRRSESTKISTLKKIAVALGFNYKELLQ
jgi:transcriptional regulator with XRE-family HTH domain